jgi:hypothetical protein
MRLLVNYGASIHEVAYGKTLGMLNIVQNNRKARTVEFFCLLLSEGFINFDTIDETWLVRVTHGDQDQLMFPTSSPTTFGDRC